MRKVSKDFDARPSELFQCFKAKEKSVLEKGMNNSYSFDGRCYNQTIAPKLKAMYKNKCAFCETRMSDKEFTVEHYRPKKGGYYWLGYEWSNLIPTCKDCNDAKGDKFPISGFRDKVKKPPLNADGKTLELNAAKANSPSMLAELPHFLHPEIDSPDDYFEISNEGKLIAKKGLNNYGMKRVESMIEIIKINREKFCIPRKKILDDFRRLIEKQTQRCLKTIQNGKDEITDSIIELTYFSLFEQLIEFQNEANEYTFFHKELFRKFDVFVTQYIIHTIGEEAGKLIQYSFELFVTREYPKK